MKQVSLGKAAIAVSVFACAATLSFDWSQGNGPSISVENAQARVGRPLTPVSVAGVARRQARRGAYGYGAGVVGAGLVGAGAVAAAGYYGATAPYGGGYYTGGYYGGSPYAYYGAPYQDYKTRNGFICTPGTRVKLDDGRMYNCQ